MSAPRRIAVVGGADIPEVRAALARRHVRGVLLFHDRRGSAEPDDVIDVVEGADFRQPLVAARRIVELHRTFHFAGILGLGEHGLLPAALAAQQLALPGPSLRAVMDTRDKVRMREVLSEKGLGQVRFAHCRSDAEVRRFLRSIGAPIIVKPPAGTGSEGVALVRDETDAAAAFALAAESSSTAGVLCEEFVPGEEVSIEGYSVGAVFQPVAMTDKRTDERFLELGHDQPSAQPGGVQAAAFALTGRILAALGVRDGATHTEMRLTRSGPVLIETHTRMAGDRIPVLTERTTGVCLADVMVGIALGEKPDRRPEATGRGAAIRFLKGRAGRVEAVHAPRAAQDSGVEEVHLVVRPGDVLSGRSSSSRRLGYVLAVGSDAAEAGASADGLVREIQVSYTQEVAACPLSAAS